MEGMTDKKELVKELKELMKKAYIREGFGFQDKIVKKVNALRKKYSSPENNYQDYEMYHVLTNSSLTRPSKEFDFPGEDSIEKFIRDSHKEYFSK